MSRRRRAWLGVDIGTTSIAAVVVDRRGRVLDSRTLPNPSAGEPTADGRHEQDADAILEAVNGLIGGCEGRNGDRPPTGCLRSLKKPLAFR